METLHRSCTDANKNFVIQKQSNRVDSIKALIALLDDALIQQLRYEESKVPRYRIDKNEAYR